MSMKDEIDGTEQNINEIVERRIIAIAFTKLCLLNYLWIYMLQGKLKF